MSCPPSPGRTPTARATSATWPVSACPPTSSAGTCGWPATTCSWSRGTDEHGTPILVAADKEGVTARELADKNNAVIVQDLVDLGLSYDLFTRTTTGNHYLVVQEMFATVYRNGYMVEQTTQGRDQPLDRPHPARPLHRGHLPDLRVRRGARRPVRQLRQPARRDRPDRPALEDQRRDAGASSRPSTSSSTCPALADALGEWLDEREATGTWRPNVIKFCQNILKDIRPRAMTRDIDWGIPVPLDGWRDQPTKRLYVWFDAVIGYLSASIEWARRLGRARALARVVERPGGAVLLLHGQGQHRLPLPDLAGRAAGVRRAGRPGRRARAVRRAQPADRGGLQRVPDDGEQAVLHQPRPRDLRRRHAGALPARRAALLHLRGRPGDLRRRLHLGRLRARAPTPSWSPAGATWSTGPPR